MKIESKLVDSRRNCQQQTQRSSTLSTTKMNNRPDLEYYTSEGEESYSISCPPASKFVRCDTNSGSVVSDFGSDGAAVDSPVALNFDSSEWSDDDECFVSDISKSAYRKSWTDSGVSSTKTDSQPGSLVNRVKRPVPIDLRCDFQHKSNQFGSPKERRSLREVKRSNRSRIGSSQDAKGVSSSLHADQSLDDDEEHVQSRGIPACDGTSTLMKELSTWTPKEREILCQVLENARDVGISKKSTTKDVVSPKKSSKKKELLDYPLSKYRDSEDNTNKPAKQSKSIMSGLRKISLGLKRRKDSTSSKRKDPSTPQNIVYQDYISKYLDPSDESDISDDEADEISHLGNAPKKAGLLKRVFQRRSSRTYLAPSGSPSQPRDSSPRASSATPRLRRNRSQSTRSIPDSFRGLFSRKRCQSVESLHGVGRRRLPHSRSALSLAVRSPVVQKSQRFGGSTISLTDKAIGKEMKCYRRYDSVRSLIQPAQYDVVTHLIGDSSNHRQPGADINDCNLEKLRRRRMSAGQQRTPNGYTLNEFFPIASESVKSSVSSYTDDYRCHDIGYESCYDDGLFYDDDSSVDHELTDSTSEMIVAPLQMQRQQSLVASKRLISYSQNSSFV